MNKTIDEIINKYKYIIDISDRDKTANRINDYFYARLITSIDKYCFNERIIKLNEILGKNKNKIDENILQLYIKELKEIEDTIKQILDKQREDYFFNSKLLYELTKDCENDKDNLEVINIYNKIGKDILDKEAKKYIKIEKLFLTFNDNLIDITNKLNLNNIKDIN